MKTVIDSHSWISLSIIKRTVGTISPRRDPRRERLSQGRVASQRLNLSHRIGSSISISHVERQRLRNIKISSSSTALPSLPNLRVCWLDMDLKLLQNNPHVSYKKCLKMTTSAPYNSNMSHKFGPKLEIEIWVSQDQSIWWPWRRGRNMLIISLIRYQRSTRERK